MKTLAIVIVVLFLVWFGWFQIRPAIIHSKCHKKAQSEAVLMYAGKCIEYRSKDYCLKKAKEGWYLKADYESLYKECLRSKGLEPKSK